MKEVHNLLNYLYRLEFFSPFWPERTKDTQLVNSDQQKVSWIVRTNPKYMYDVYLGKIETQFLIDQLLAAISEENHYVERDNTPTCLCAFKVSYDGIYIEDSFSISPFVWAFAKIINGQNLMTELKETDIQILNSQVNEILMSFNSPLTYEDIEKIFYIIADKISFHTTGIRFQAVMKRTIVKREQNMKGNDLNPTEQDNDMKRSTEMMTSFYLSDIDMVRSNVQQDDEIVHYIKALIQPEEDRIEIDKSIAEMQKWLSPDRYPLGKWPSKYSPSLMQQLAINIGISKEGYKNGLFSVNGPPGTGKTTLLKEIIASHIVNRAIHLSEYKHPDSAFKKQSFLESENQYLKNFYILDDHLIQYGLIVASNNNAAVENISMELPLAKDVKEANTRMFNVDESYETYFSEIAQALSNGEEKCWGLISARLGKKSNIDELKAKLWFDKDVNLRNLYYQTLPDWDQAKELFKSKYLEVINYREEIKKEVNTVNQHELLVQQCEQAYKKMTESKIRLDEVQRQLEQETRHPKDLQSQLDMLEKNVSLLEGRLPWYKKWFRFLFKRDLLLQEIKKYKHELERLTVDLTSSLSKIEKLKTLVAKSNLHYTQNKSEYEQKESSVNNSLQELKKLEQKYGQNFAGNNFWKDIEYNQLSQESCPWTNGDYDKLREELFYYALMLHKAFILNSKSVKQNLSGLMNAWSNKLSEKDMMASFPHLLNTLFLVIPVVSTTFASISRFLKYVGKQQLGTLVIDEAGQAAPQAALGAIWRTKKAIVVGDPLQVEPVVTVPKELSNRLAEELKIETPYRKREVSVQVLADSINPFGGYRKANEQMMWLGCPLVVHRRCIDPMFSISNNIAYNNRMFIATTNPKSEIILLFEKSVWIDIAGESKGNKNHYVPEQGDIVVKLIKQAISMQNGLPDLYIISPFKSVSNQMKRSLRQSLQIFMGADRTDEINDWLKKSCGTVHTFQGKQANEVIFLLGCDMTSGMGAAQWAGLKPNILNVAVTRAKYRLAIIGDSNLWTRVPHFDTAYQKWKNG